MLSRYRDYFWTGVDTTGSTPVMLLLLEVCNKCGRKLSRRLPEDGGRAFHTTRESEPAVNHTVEPVRLLIQEMW
jgi:hypothetical protein